CSLSFEALVQRANSDLANDLGNLLSRTAAMIARYRDGVVPEGGAAGADADLAALAGRVVADYRAHFDRYDFSRALESVWELIARVNKYIVENQPWTLAKDPADAGRLDRVLFHAAESLRLAAVLLAPVIPEAAQTMWRQLGLEGEAAGQRLDTLAWSATEMAGRRLGGGAALLPRPGPDAGHQKL